MMSAGSLPSMEGRGYAMARGRQEPMGSGGAGGRFTVELTTSGAHSFRAGENTAAAAPSRPRSAKDPTTHTRRMAIGPRVPAMRWAATVRGHKVVGSTRPGSDCRLRLL